MLALAWQQGHTGSAVCFPALIIIKAHGGRGLMYRSSPCCAAAAKLFYHYAIAHLGTEGSRSSRRASVSAKAVEGFAANRRRQN